MKMSDKFQLPVFYECDPLSEVAKFSAWQGNGEICKSLFLAFDDCDADLICEAINNHDRMVEEIAEFREALPVIKQMIFSMKTNAHTFSNENVEEVSREGRAAMRLIDKLLAKLNQEGEG
ncbi:hypothetical protein NVP1256O_09 [Vibrio phage 1.256.O._10N.286.45.F8]|nr:hypothetical protein NVP1256O_09 [Vibrio phage 1.256.O._10N.286.45.F8]